MKSEFDKQISKLNLSPEEKRELQTMLRLAAKEFPCLSCLSSMECQSFQWFAKWFGQPKLEN